MTAQQDYQAWLAGPEWAASRARFRRRVRGRRCAFHGRSCHVVQAHHWTRGFYRHKGRERTWMLVALCDRPHRAVHALSRVAFRHHLRLLPVTTALVVGVGKALQLVTFLLWLVLGMGPRP